ncbi:2-succinyl-5-enolpyruvyl-6-hydroxy-3-cyclohexene-1-carboxylic-acid synthase [Bacillus sp. CECT 9360]|uniref:2-succinyl-5-enolpyruvyl-6-hydroxy-3- cyclohexene-1-carboxylic-acid synthase n=1 Tax=Bacillus sp. CECT 9360 TaxID=2845821 RepID=UPI001E313145|nr:2-succinyl-5-enolpyruvyl-6-hydroxy-3-cyclohexene-1-carboxylic-acid synthase [Bacillus sp. CECT 9360]CAH0346778.1 2-succinyl-5-enolpyruvyl-6-hydroxy-3-cyclohexene-1-carboxylate synthase [Bacillus sp. CECT 9360]
MNDRQAITAYIASFVDELAQTDVKHVVVSPGSRSTPLALVLAEHPDITVHLNIDERSAAFFALGLAKALHEPVAIVCTSGTATANYYPAIIEAYYSRVPLVVLTADRPHELRDVSAPQAIDQVQMYGKHVKWFVEMAIPEHSEEMIRYARTIGARAVATAAKEPAGPVHLNFPLREPLVPLMDDVKNYRIVRERKATAVTVERGELTLSPTQLQAIANALLESKQGIIVCGELKNEEIKAAVMSLAEKLSFPILADPLSQIRSGIRNSEHIIDCYDTFLRDDNAVGVLKPDLVLRFGAMPVSKALLLYLKKHRHAKHLVVDGGSGWREPAGLVTEMIYSNELLFCSSVLERLEKNEDDTWREKWLKVNNTAKYALSSIRDEQALDEGKLFLLLQDLMPENSSLFVGNSMPIRDLDTFFFSNDKEIRIFANRGANGIDGIISTALGVSTIMENTVLVIGDLSFFHDMNGLMAAKLQQTNITIVLINNDGGGIFSFLPQASEKDYFEMLFGTPHGLNFAHAVALYEGKYTNVGNWDEFSETFTKSFNIPGLKVIEVPTNRESNVLKHRNLWSHVSQEIKEALREELE